MLFRSVKKEDPAPAPAIALADDGDTVVITVRGVPKRASIQVNGESSKLSFTTPRSKKAVKVEVSLDGYASVVRRVVPLRDKSVLIRLKKRL